MADKKYQVFVSSTFRDLIEHRRDIIKSVLDLGHIPAAMEYFPASDEEQFRYIKRVIDQCDYYVLVLAGKYGSTAPNGISFTEKEYDYAIEKGKFVLGFPIRDVGKLPREQTEEGDKAKSLSTFRAKVMEGRLVREWDDRQHLDNQVTKALAIAFAEFPQDGWVRSPKNSNEALLEEINDLTKENTRLRRELNEIRSSLKPSVENIADIDELFNIRYTYSEFVSGHAQTRNGERQLSWAMIFKAVALQIVKPTATKMIDNYISAYMRAERLTTKTVDLNHIDEAQIKLQLHNLGLIRVFVSETTKGGVDEFMDLTPRGRQLRTEMMIVRKSEPGERS